MHQSVCDAVRTDTGRPKNAIIERPLDNTQLPIPSLCLIQHQLPIPSLCLNQHQSACPLPWRSVECITCALRDALSRRHELRIHYIKVSLMKLPQTDGISRTSVDQRTYVLN